MGKTVHIEPALIQLELTCETNELLAQLLLHFGEPPKIDWARCEQIKRDVQRQIRAQLDNAKDDQGKT